MKVKLLIVDDHPMLRHGVSQIISHESNLVLVAETSTAAQALSLTKDLCPDLVVMDFYLPDGNGIEATRQILNLQPGIKIIFFSSNASRPIIDEALQAGACGYVLKSGDVAELILAIGQVMAGRLYLSPDINTGILEDYRRNLRGEGGSPLSLLTDREKLLLRLVAHGRRNKEIAVELAISIKTVEANRSRLMKKLQCDSSADLVRYAVHTGISAP